MFIKAQSKVTKAVVYRTGAFVIRSATIHLPQGNSRLCFDRLSSSMVEETFQISMPSGLFCNQVRYDARYALKKKPVEPEESDEISELRKRIKELEDALTVVAFAYKTVTQEIPLKQEEAFSVDGLKAYVDYVYDKQNELLEKRRRLDQEKETVNRKLEKYAKEGMIQKEDDKTLSGAVILDVNAVQEGDYKIEIMAYDRNVSWYPFYDICVDSLTQPMSVILKGKIQQHTGEEWENVGLIISTGNLRQSNNQPELKPWKLYLRKEIIPPYAPYVPGEKCPVAPPIPARPNMEIRSGETSVLETAVLLDERKWVSGNQNEIAENQTSIEYRLSGTYHLQDTEEGNIVEISKSNVDAEYCHYITPKAECSAYLMALVKNWRAMDWLECDANIFLEHQYVGATHINPQGMDELFKISLGRDRFITVQRRRLKKNVSKRFLGNMQFVDCEYLLKVKNEKQQEVHMMIIDQIPITENEKIIVDILNMSEAELDSLTGKVTWKSLLKAGEELELLLAYRISWPKGMLINI